MTPAIEIRPLRPEDDRGGFACGQDDLDRFFRHDAGQNQFRHRLCVSYIAVLGDRIAGFATVMAGTIESRNHPSARTRRRLPAYPLPVLRLARLGVDARAQGLGIGKSLLAHVLRLAIAQRDGAGGVGVVVDAKPDAEGFCEGLGFVPFEGVRQGEVRADARPLFLPIATVSAALGGERG